MLKDKLFFLRNVSISLKTLTLKLLILFTSSSVCETNSPTFLILKERKQFIVILLKPQSPICFDASAEDIFDVEDFFCVRKLPEIFYYKNY